MRIGRFEKFDCLLSSIAAAGTFAFFLAVVIYGWILAFQAMAR